MEIYLVTALINGLVFGAICAFVSNKKGNSTGNGFAFGFFLGVFGLIYIALEKNSDTKDLRSRIALGELKACPCGNIVLANIAVCPVCGKEIGNILPSLTDYDNAHPITYKFSQKLLLVVSLVCFVFPVLTFALVDNALGISFAIKELFFFSLITLIAGIIAFNQKTRSGRKNMLYSTGIWLGIIEILFGSIWALLGF